MGPKTNCWWTCALVCLYHRGISASESPYRTCPGFTVRTTSPRSSAATHASAFFVQAFWMQCRLFDKKQDRYRRMAAPVLALALALLAAALVAAEEPAQAPPTDADNVAIAFVKKHCL